MATVPLSGTNIKLLANIPFSNDYKHTRWFDDVASQTAYFLNKTVVYDLADYNFQRIEGKSFISVNKSIDQLWGTNYLMFQNADYNNKWFYAFVTKLEYRQKNTTHVYFEIDVLQTWRFDFTWKPSFVAREHRTLWNADQTPVINTLDEGLAYGTEYDIVKVDKWQVYSNLLFMVIIAKKPFHTGSPAVAGTYNPEPQPLSYYVHPFLNDGATPTTQINGTAVALSDVLEFINLMFENVTSVNDIVSMYITDNIAMDCTWDGTTLNILSDFQAVTLTNTSETTIFAQFHKDFKTVSHSFGNKYDGFKTVTESKLLMYPYALTIIDDFKGNRQIIKNEYIKDTNLTIVSMGSLGTSNKVAFYPKNYNSTNQDAVMLEFAVINMNPNDVAVLSDYLGAYIQGNRNQLMNQKDSILWDAKMGMVSGGIGAIAGASRLNTVGVASSVTSTVKGLGDDRLRMEGLLAKIKDISNLPPNLVKMGSNTSFDFGNGYIGIYVIKKQITDEYIIKLEDYFKMFGYKTNEVKVPNLHTRTSWNYVETKSCNLIGNFNNDDIQELKNVFDNGVTLWHTDDVGNYDLANGVR